MDNPDALNRPYISADELIERIRRYHPDDDMDLGPPRLCLWRRGP